MPTIAFFGATGGCANACLVHALRDGNHCVALARSPDKLRSQLQGQGLANSLLTSHLTIVQGNALCVEDVKKTLVDPPYGNSDSSKGTGTKLVDTIVSGLGSAPAVRFGWHHFLFFFTLDNPTLCESAAATLVNALDTLTASSTTTTTTTARPALVFISTTGITAPGAPDDVPFWLRFLYRRALVIPHEDKKKMERVFDTHGRLFSTVTAIRPTLLVGSVNADDQLGLDRVRAGTEARPATGYQIKRADVGHWIYANTLRPGEARNRWAGQRCSLTS